ncbi:hypothetical protein RSK20926_07082 [Roseobacter sp. SK209-2-6]|nr:hypothetical protein RSK20926_07082 [Roseobacter sp. SK209-2-6]
MLVVAPGAGGDMPAARLGPADLNSRNVHKHIFANAVGCDETEAFGRFEPFYGAGGHIRSLLLLAARIGAAA